MKEQAYISLVRSVLEYAATIWDPHESGDIKLLESVQRRSARFVMNDYKYTSSVSDMLSDLGWITLADRRKDLRLILLYKIIHGVTAVPTDNILVKADLRTRTGTSHNYKFMHLQPNTSAYKFSYFPKTIRDWNSMPAAIVECSSLELFKQQLVLTH